MPHCKELLTVLFALTLFLSRGIETRADESGPVGKRPYELQWANRVADDHTPLVDFEGEAPWTVESSNAEATFEKSREQWIWGDHTGRLVYRGTGDAPVVTVRPSEPIPVPSEPFDAMSLWIYGNAWAWEKDLTTPFTTIQIMFRFPDGTEIAKNLITVVWKEWHLAHIRLTPEEQEQYNQAGVAVTGIRVLGGSNTDDRVLFFDNLALFREEFGPLEFTARPKRNLTLFPGQTPGQNTGEGTLPFPTRESTIIPEPEENAVNTLTRENDAWLFTCSDSEGKLVVRYTPDAGTWSDVSASWNDSKPFLPMKEGGINQLVVSGKMPEPVISRKFLDAKVDGKRLDVRWELRSESISQEVVYRFELIGKCLVVDTMAPGGQVPAVEFGSIADTERATAFPIPYYQYGYADNLRPFAVLFLAGECETPLFLLSQFDWYRSNASNVRPNPRIGIDDAVSGPVMAYNTKTDGKYNDVYERFTVTISSHFADVLPVIANPVSPWKEVTGKKVWHAHGAGNPRQNDYRHWHNYWRHGIREMLVTDHETCWRDGGESFTFRTRAAPAKGGDQGMADYSRYMQDTLGYVYGPYNNFTDFAPVNEYWSYDMVTRTSENQLLPAWARCYAPKPSRAVEFCEKLSPINQEKFKFSTAYCDVHTAVAPWERTDYDWRVPGAGTFAATYYPFGEIMLLQKKAWNGPVYSEGNFHCFYSGLTDGNYGQDQSYAFTRNPWLVDFDLLKIHPQECNFGMGNLQMYDPAARKRRQDAEGQQAFLDEFLAATLAFGHPGFLVTDFGMVGAMTSYFMIQQIAAHYTQTEVASIAYLDAAGQEYNTDAALANGIISRRQLVVRYQDGTVVCVNGNANEAMTLVPANFASKTQIMCINSSVTIPPLGWAAWTEENSVISCSCLTDNVRCDFCVSPDYVFVNTRNNTIHLPWALGNGVAVCRILENHQYEIIPEKGELGFALDVNRAVALDIDEKELCETPVHLVNGYAFIDPVAGAESYRLDKVDKPTVKISTEPVQAVPGEMLKVVNEDGKEQNEGNNVQITIAHDAPVGSLLRQDTPFGTIPVPVAAPFFIKSVQVCDKKICINVLVAQGNTQEVRLEGTLGDKSLTDIRSEMKGQNINFEFDFDCEADSVPLSLNFTCGAVVCKKQYTIHRSLFETVARLSSGYQGLTQNLLSAPARYIQYRGQSPTTEYGNTGTVFSFRSNVTCGNIPKSGIFIHPPYVKGTGCAWLENTFTVPVASSVDFAAQVGKVDESTSGDGIRFLILLTDDKGTEHTLADATVREFKWQKLNADLTPWCGQRVTIKCVSDVGPDDNSNGDWSAWGEVVLTKAREMPVYSLEEMGSEKQK